MKATLTSKGQITIPKSIRDRLGLKPGHVIEFDESAPLLVGRCGLAEDAFEKSRALVGTESTLTSRQWLDDLRGPVELPDAEP